MKKVSLSIEQMEKLVNFQIFLCTLFHWSQLKFFGFHEVSADRSKKLLLFLENVNQYLKLKADIVVFSSVTEKS